MDASTFDVTSLSLKILMKTNLAKTESPDIVEISTGKVFLLYRIEIESPINWYFHGSCLIF